MLQVALGEGMRRRSYWPAVQKGSAMNNQAQGQASNGGPPKPLHSTSTRLRPAPPSRKNQNLG